MRVYVLSAAGRKYNLSAANPHRAYRGTILTLFTLATFGQHSGRRLSLRISLCSVGEDDKKLWFFEFVKYVLE